MPQLVTEKLKELRQTISKINLEYGK